jgi:phosphoribosyl 1,2-cyclic phosphate phosphodiesterase
MHVTILGCGASAGVPRIGGADGTGDWGVCDPAEPRNRRTRSSIVIERAGQRLLVDTSPDMRSQLLACAIPSIHAVLFTHSHADHIIGLDDVRILNRIVNRPLEAFAGADTLADLKIRVNYAFEPWRPPGFFRPVMTARPVVPGECVEMAGMDVALFEQDHGGVKTLGCRIGAFAYSTDVVMLDDRAFDILAGVDTWVVGCFQREAHRTHASINNVIEWSRRIGARRTVLTHMGTDLDWAWMQANLPGGIEPSHDGLVLEIPD